jgi:hypothetical protein
MKNSIIALLVAASVPAFGALPSSYKELLPFVMKAPDQGETNTCLYVASTGAMELLMNKKDNLRNPRPGSKNDLSESFVIWQRDWRDRRSPTFHFIEDVVRRFNHGEAVHISHWPFAAKNSDGTDNYTVWDRHPEFFALPRLPVPAVKTEFLFARGKKHATRVLAPRDVEHVKKMLVERRAPVIVNYNDDDYWHVVLIVGYDDRIKGSCYEIDADECNPRGAFYVRDSNGNRFEARAYNWFLYNGNAAAVVELK